MSFSLTIGGKNAERWRPERAIDAPLRWRKPRHVWVVSDLFHEGVPFDYVDKVFAVMALTPRHTYQVLTKRPERMAEYARADYLTGGAKGRAWRILEAARALAKGRGSKLMNDAAVIAYPLPNVHLGTSVEDQKRADERIPHLLRCPAAVRFLSVEPLLSDVNLSRWIENRPRCAVCGRAFSRASSVGYYPCPWHTDVGEMIVPEPTGIDWVIVGGESGPGARPCDVDWIRSIVRQCKDAAVPVFVKQLGADAYSDTQCFCGQNADGHWKGPAACFACAGRLGLRDTKGGDMAEWPEDLRVRQMPGEAVPR